MRKMMNCTTLACALALLAGPSRAEDKTLAIVVKGLDNPFFDLIRQGCEKAQAELKDGYKCFTPGRRRLRMKPERCRSSRIS